MNPLNWFLNTVVISAVLGAAVIETPVKFNETAAQSEFEASPYIVGGQRARAFAYPFMVFVTDQRQQCGGTIVAHNLVVTAAHCIGSTNPGDYRVVAHRYNLQTPEQSEQAITFRVKQVIGHPSYNRQALINDIAVLILDNDNPNAVPGANMDNMIQLDTQGPQEGITTKVIGWGRTIGGGATSPILKETDLRVASAGTCQGIFGNFFNAQLTICGAAMRQGDSVCSGDSGGPLVANGNTLVGVVSYAGENCDTPATGFTKVAQYVNWINQYRTGGSSQQPQQPQQPEQPQQNWWEQQQPQQPQQNWWEQQPQQNWWEQQGAWWPQQQQGGWWGW